MSESKTKSARKIVETTHHYDDKRMNIPTAELQSVMEKQDQSPIRVAFERRNPDLDPQLIWRGKGEEDSFEVLAPPIYIQEKVDPLYLVNDLESETKKRRREEAQLALFGDFNGLPEGADKTAFYEHEGNWANRFILGDSLQVMSSLAEREGMRGAVQCIYFDPPYGIKFNSNFQWSTTNRDVKDGNRDHITREPEMVKAFRDTWQDGVHSYLSVIRSRLELARILLSETGSIFVQIGEENVHRVRAIMDEVFGDANFVSMINYATTGGFETQTLGRSGDHILWFAKRIEILKYRALYTQKTLDTLKSGDYRYVQDERLTRSVATSDDVANDEGRRFRFDNLLSQGSSSESQPFTFRGRVFTPPASNHWKAHYPSGMQRLAMSGRLEQRPSSLAYVRFLDDFGVMTYSNSWSDTSVAGSKDGKIYVVQTNPKVVERCILMASDPGDLVLDPTCGSGTTAYVAEQWGRRWITIDTSRVAVALARSRVMGARFPYYLLADSPAGQQKESEITGLASSVKSTFGNIRHGFVSERVPHVTLKSIANNSEIDVIWAKYEEHLYPLREHLSKVAAFNGVPAEWELPREAPKEWSTESAQLLRSLWDLLVARQNEIDASIEAKAEQVFLYDKPFIDPKRVRVSGRFTVESLSPHRTLAVNEDNDLFDPGQGGESAQKRLERDGFVEMVLENLLAAGVQQASRTDKISFNLVRPWPGRYICAEGLFREELAERRAAIFVGPEFGTVSRQDLVEAAREAGDADHDVLVACAFSFDAHSSEFEKLGRIPVLKARMNADLHMADELKSTGKGNLFVIFGEPDIDVTEERGSYTVRINGVDVFDPRTGEIRSDGAEGIACWFLDTDYNGESFFVRHAYFPGMTNDPYRSLKTTLKAEIDEEAWESLRKDVSRPFPRPQSGRIAVKVINHLGDEVMKVYRI